MHDTAYLIGRLFLETYGAVSGGSIVEVGALDVNGSLRELAPLGTYFIGLDIEPGPGVDVVAPFGRNFPLDDCCADIVIASSVFEHDPAFWLTFREMCRIAKPGGFIYISAPANGMVHRYPMDCWRLYPDAGRALELASRREGPAVTLVESFIAERMTDQWNDFVAVFRRDADDTKHYPERLHRRVACRNIFDMEIDMLDQEEPDMEDIRLLSAARAELTQAQTELTILRTQAAESGEFISLIRHAVSRVDYIAHLQHFLGSIYEQNEIGTVRRLDQINAAILAMRDRNQSSELVLQGNLATLTARGDMLQRGVEKLADQLARAMAEMDRLTAASSQREG